MIRENIREWLEAHPDVAGYVLLGGVYLSYALDAGTTGAGGGYQGP